MELQTISQISKSFKLSTRTLRYYEQIGLIQSTKVAEYAYRTYDAQTVLRLQQIVVLRKLRIPLKQIIVILESKDSAEIIATFEQNLKQVADEITALSTIRTILNTFIVRLNESTQLNLKRNLLDDVSILPLFDSLITSKIHFKEDKTMEDLNQANDRLEKLTDREVRILYLPPMSVAALHIIGKTAELEGKEPIYEFIQKTSCRRSSRISAISGSIIRMDNCQMGVIMAMKDGSPFRMSCQWRHPLSRKPLPVASMPPI